MIRISLLTALLGKRKASGPPPVPAPWEGESNYHRILASIVPTFQPKRVYYTGVYTAEHITAGISNVSFVVTKV